MDKAQMLILVPEWQHSQDGAALSISPWFPTPTGTPDPEPPPLPQVALSTWNVAGSGWDVVYLMWMLEYLN